MQPIDIEKSTSGSSGFGSSSTPNNSYGTKNTFVQIAAALALLPAGYHLSVFNTIGFYIQEISAPDLEYFTFRNITDALFCFVTCATIYLITFRRIELNGFKQYFLIGDILMIIGSALSFELFTQDFFFCALGRIITGLSVGTNLATVYLYLREYQFYYSESDFKVEKRRFYTEVFFALGVFLALIPPELFDTIAQYAEHKQNHFTEEKREADYTVDFYLAFVPIVASLARIGMFKMIGEQQIPSHSSKFNDDGLYDLPISPFAPEGQEYEAVGCGKKLMPDYEAVMALSNEPWRKRVEVGYMLYFLQVCVGSFVCIVNTFFVVKIFSLKSYRDTEYADPISLRLSEMNFGLFYLLATLGTALPMGLIKIKRKKIMIVGLTIGCISSFLLCVCNFITLNKYLEYLLYIYCIGSTVGLGYVIDVYLEEVVPGKSIQFMQGVKWTLITAVSVVTRYMLSLTLFDQILYLFFFLISLFSLFVVMNIIPETSDMDDNQIQSKFDEIEEEYEDRENHFQQLSSKGKDGEFGDDKNTSLM